MPPPPHLLLQGCCTVVAISFNEESAWEISTKYRAARSRIFSSSRKCRGNTKANGNCILFRTIWSSCFVFFFVRRPRYDEVAISGEGKEMERVKIQELLLPSRFPPPTQLHEPNGASEEESFSFWQGLLQQHQQQRMRHTRIAISLQPAIRGFNVRIGFLSLHLNIPIMEHQGLLRRPPAKLAYCAETAGGFFNRDKLKLPLQVFFPVHLSCLPSFPLPRSKIPKFQLIKKSF